MSRMAQVPISVTNVGDPVSKFLPQDHYHSCHQQLRTTSHGLVEHKGNHLDTRPRDKSGLEGILSGLDWFC